MEVTIIGIRTLNNNYHYQSLIWSLILYADSLLYNTVGRRLQQRCNLFCCFLDCFKINIRLSGGGIRPQLACTHEEICAAATMVYSELILVQATRWHQWVHGFLYAVRAASVVATRGQRFSYILITYLPEDQRQRRLYCSSEERSSHHWRVPGTHGQKDEQTDTWLRRWLAVKCARPPMSGDVEVVRQGTRCWGMPRV